MCADSLIVEAASYVGSPPPPPGTVISLTNTLPLLTFTDGLWVAQQSQSLDYLIDGFPKNVAVVGTYLYLRELNATDLSFLSHVSCAPNQVSIFNNLKLTSMVGFNAVILDYGTGDQFTTIANNPLLGEIGLQPLGVALQCSFGSSPVPPYIPLTVVPGDCSVVIQLPNEFCDYLGSNCGRTVSPQPGSTRPSGAGLPLATGPRAPYTRSPWRPAGAPGDSPAAPRPISHSALAPTSRKVSFGPIAVAPSTLMPAAPLRPP